MTKRIQQRRLRPAPDPATTRNLEAPHDSLD